MWKLTIEDDQANRVVVPLTREQYSIGRAEGSSLRLTERNISRQHAELLRTDHGWDLLDLSSYNGCFVNGTRVNGQQPLTHGDLIQLGDYRLELFDEALALLQGKVSDKVTAPSGPKALSLTGQPDRLVMLTAPSPGAEFSLIRGERVLIGRVEECQISINHPSVSRIHAEIVPLANGRYELVDRDSANGVRVNGVDLPRALLDARDVIELGDVVLKFIPAGDIFVADADDYVPPTLSSPGEPGSQPESVPPRPRKKPGFMILAFASLLGVAGAVIAALSAQGREPQTKEQSRNNGPPLATLKEAKRLLAAGDIPGAEQKLAAIPSASNVRQTAEYKDTVSALSDELFERAGKAFEISEKRALLARIIANPGVDTMRRERAKSLLSTLSPEQAIDVDSLPNVADH